MASAAAGSEGEAVASVEVVSAAAGSGGAPQRRATLPPRSTEPAVALLASDVALWAAATLIRYPYMREASWEDTLALADKAVRNRRQTE